MGARALMLWLLAATGCDVSRPVLHAAPPTCSAGPDLYLADVQCVAEHVTIEVAQDGCSARLEMIAQFDTSTVASGRTLAATLQATLSTDGKVVSATSDDLGACMPVEAPPESAGALRCQTLESDCRIDLYTPHPPLSAVVTRQALVRDRFRPPTIGAISLLDADQARYGYLSGGTVVAGAAWVIGHEDLVVPLRCNEAVASTLFRIPLDDIAVSTRTVGPRCLRVLAPDPRIPSGFIGMTGGREAAIYRFDATGAVTSSASLGLPDDPENRARSLTFDDDAIIATVSTIDEGRALIIDPDTLAVRHDVLFPGVVLLGAAISRHVAYLTGSDFYVHFLDEAGLSPTVALAFAGGPSAHGESYRVTEVLVTDATHLTLSTTGDRAAVWWADLATRAVLPIQPFAADVVPFSLAMLRDGSRRVAVSVVRRDDLGGELALLTPENGRFDPSTLAIGRGIPRWIGFDDRERLWAILPWSGEVAVIADLR